jgi:uncharacterized protein (DUF488 family)
MGVIFTIGHSNRDLDDIRSAMREVGVKAIFDVRLSALFKALAALQPA